VILPAMEVNSSCRFYPFIPSAKITGPLIGFISAEGMKWQYTHGLRNERLISPDNWNVDLRHLLNTGHFAFKGRWIADSQLRSAGNPGVSRWKHPLS